MYMNRQTVFSVFGAAVAALGGCAVDEADQCGPSMVYSDELHACLCVDSAIEVAGGCQLCADSEVVDRANNQCVCPEGQVRADGGVCQEVAGLGDECNGTDLPCDDTVYPLCAMPAGAATGFCTKPCAEDAECEDAYTCADWEEEPYCRSYSGVGQSCESDDDCAGTDAATCDTFQSHTCLVAGCSLELDDCPRGTGCCDLSAFGAGTLCISPEACPS
jgi:hypothetical protein